MTGTELRTLRRTLRLSQTALGRELGLSRATICRYETGQWPIPSLVATVCNLLLTKRRAP